MINKALTKPRNGDMPHWKSLLLTSGLAQAMVLFNGLILTLTAFFVLTLFISGMEKEEYRSTANDAGKKFVEGTTRMENTIRVTTGVLRLSKSSSREKIAEQIRRNIPGLNQYDQIIWVYENSPGVWKFKTIFENFSNEIPKSPFKLMPDPLLIKRLASNDILGNEDMHVAFDLPKMEYSKEADTPLTMSKPYAFIQSVEKNNGNLGIIIGISRAVYMFEPGWVDKEKTISKLSVREKASQERLYFIDRTNGTSQKRQYSQNYVLGVGDTEWEVQFDFVKPENLALLSKVPFLILIFGAILTVIGTLFVRSNQKQAKRVNAMNKILEQKNYELESEASERERLNHALSKAERDNRAIIDSVSDVIFETDTYGNILFLSAAWLKITGFDIERTKGNDLFSMLYPEDQKRQRNDFELMVKGQKQAYRSLTRIRTSDGTFRSVELSVSMLRQDENKKMRVVGTINDVEERRRAERALAEAEKKYRTIVENAAGGLYQLTPEGLYLSANPAMARILGYESVEDMLREIKNANGSVYKDTDAREAFTMGLVKAGQIFGYETQVYKKDKTVIWVRENIRAVKDDEGHVLYYEGSMEDITKSKEAEIELRRAKIQSDTASRSKTEFIANMSHELRTPLNAIIGFSEIMKNQILGPLGQEMYVEYASDIHESGKGLLKIINDILDISKIETGNRELKESEFSMEEVLRTCKEIIGGKAKSKGISIVDETRDLPDILGEELAIKQTITNICSNALKFTNAGGRMTIFSNYDHDGGFRLSFNDTGVGLTHEEIEKALSPFGQAENALDRSSSGAGLGLTLSQSIMKLHRGKLEMISEKGIGTTVTLVFPAERVSRPQTISSKQESKRPDILKNPMHALNKKNADNSQDRQ